MNKLKIAWLSDFDTIGSGYQHISTVLCNGLVRSGHEVKAIGLHYMGQEHWNDFSIIPVQNLKESIVSVYNLRSLWNFDVLIVALDINLQNFIMGNIQNFRSLFKYIGIMPVESDPLCVSWAMILLQMDLPLIISKFGTEEAHKANVLAAKHIELGVDLQVWNPLTSEERTKARKKLFGVQDDSTFVVLTVADNQERKNLSAAMEAYAIFSKDNPDSKYVLITREGNPVGWSLRDLAAEYGIIQNTVFIERGLPQEMLRNAYGGADCFLLTSKAEGLGMPLLEAMSMRLPCIATDCTGMKELLEEGRGILIPSIMVHRDCFGNGRRYWIDIVQTANALQLVQSKKLLPDIEAARKYVENMKWENTTKFLNDEIINLMEKK